MSLCCLLASDWIAIADIVITSCIGIWIAITVQNNFTRKRYFKEFIIHEIVDIRDMYKLFFTDIYYSRKSAKEIKEWLKIMSSKINNIDNVIEENFKILDRNLLPNQHAIIQQTLTFMDDFNNQYTKDRVIFSEEAKNKILELNSVFSKIIITLTVEINNSNLKHKCHYKRK